MSKPIDRELLKTVLSPTQFKQANMFRRHFLKLAGAAGAVTALSVAGMSSKAFGQEEEPEYTFSDITDVNIFNFALNLEYLEAEFYSYAQTGMGLPSSLTSGTGTQGTVTPGSKAVLTSDVVKQLSVQLYTDEVNHVTDIRGLLGDMAVAEPDIDVSAAGAFTTAAIAAGIITSGQTFDPYASDANFLLGSFIFEDVGVTAYKGAAKYISDKTLLSDAAGILAVEAYHAGAIRTLILTTGTNADITDANKISALRASADGKSPNGKDTPLTSGGVFHFVSEDPTTSIAYGRNFAEVLRIVYLGHKAGVGGGFFPNKLNGVIQ